MLKLKLIVDSKETVLTYEMLPEAVVITNFENEDLKEKVGTLEFQVFDALNMPNINSRSPSVTAIRGDHHHIYLAWRRLKQHLEELEDQATNTQ